MPVDASIFSQYLKPPKSVSDYQADADVAQTRKNALQLAAMDLDQKTQANQRAGAVRNALMGLGPTATDEQRISALRGTATPEGFAQADALDKSIQERLKTKSVTAKDDAATAASKLDQSIKAHDFHLQQLGSVTDPEGAKAWAIAGLKSGVFTPEQFAGGFTNIPTDPAGFAQWKQTAMQGGVNATEQLKMQQQKLIADNNNKTSIATNAATVGVQSARLAETRRHNGVSEEQNATALSGVGMDTPDGQKQLDYWADVIRKGGTLPPGLARGKEGSAFVREVTKRAALGGTSAEDLMANQAEFVGAKAGQRTLGTKQANIEMAATEAYNMMPIAIAASNKVDRTQYPMLNKVLMAAEKGTGDTNVVQLSVAVNSLVNSYSRAISPSGTPTVSDKEHAREILEKAYSKGQFAAAVDLMKQEIEQARKSPAQVRAHMRPGAQAAPDAAPKTVNFGDLK